jgi:hypothetical protein
VPILAYEHNRSPDIADTRGRAGFGPHDHLGPSSDVPGSSATRLARPAARTALRGTRLALGCHRTASADSSLLRIASSCPASRRCPHGPEIQRSSAGDARLIANVRRASPLQCSASASAALLSAAPRPAIAFFSQLSLVLEPERSAHPLTRKPVARVDPLEPMGAVLAGAQA